MSCCYDHVRATLRNGVACGRRCCCCACSWRPWLALLCEKLFQVYDERYVDGTLRWLRATLPLRRRGRGRGRWWWRRRCLPLAPSASASRSMPHSIVLSLSPSPSLMRTRVRSCVRCRPPTPRACLSGDNHSSKVEARRLSRDRRDRRDRLLAFYYRRLWRANPSFSLWPPWLTRGSCRSFTWLLTRQVCGHIRAFSYQKMAELNSTRLT